MFWGLNISFIMWAKLLTTKTQFQAMCATLGHLTPNQLLTDLVHCQFWVGPPPGKAFSTTGSATSSHDLPDSLVLNGLSVAHQGAMWSL